MTLDLDKLERRERMFVEAKGDDALKSAYKMLASAMIDAAPALIAAAREAEKLRGEVDELIHDIGRHIEICSHLATESAEFQAKAESLDVENARLRAALRNIGYPKEFRVCSTCEKIARKALAQPTGDTDG